MKFGPKPPQESFLLHFKKEFFEKSFMINFEVDNSTTKFFVTSKVENFSNSITHHVYPRHRNRKNWSKVDSVFTKSVIYYVWKVSSFLKVARNKIIGHLHLEQVDFRAKLKIWQKGRLQGFYGSFPKPKFQSCPPWEDLVQSSPLRRQISCQNLFFLKKNHDISSS